MKEINKLKDKKIYIFGAGRYGKKTLDHCLKMDYKVFAIFDNNEAIQGKNKFYGIDIMAPRFIEGDVLIVVSSIKYEIELIKQLVTMGYNNQQFISFEEFIIEYPLDKDDEKEIIKEYPSVIQLPITNKCNMDCVMCGVHNHINDLDIFANDYQQILEDELFKNVHTVGINGGEPFLKSDLVECIEKIIKALPRLKNMYIITNGYLTDIIEDKLFQIKKLCNKRGVFLSVSISVDGVGDLQDFHRGLKGAFYRCDKTCDILKYRKKELADRIGIICTITRHNIARINEVCIWAESKGINVNYNIATENVRIDNYGKLEDFSVFSDEISRALAEEFFYAQYVKTGSEKYFAIFLFLKYKQRFAKCPYKTNEWITLLPNGDIAFCAPRSKTLGSAINESAYTIVKKDIEYIGEIKNRYCNTCGQYITELDVSGKEKMYSDIILNSPLRW